MNRRRFTLEKKMVVQVRYYEYMYVVRDGKGERIYTGTDEKFAKHVVRLLNGYDARIVRKTKLSKRKKR